MSIGNTRPSRWAASRTARLRALRRFAVAAALIPVVAACPGTWPIPTPGDSDDDSGTQNVEEACTPGDPDACDDGLTCCDEICVDTTSNPSHCGGCGSSCGATGFCATGTQCTELRFSNLCANDSFVVAFDGALEDDVSATELRQALEEHCSAATFVSVDNTEPGVFAPETGQPILLGGNTLVIAGGDFFQPAVGWLEEAGVTPVYFERSTGRIRFRATSDDHIIADIAAEDLNPSHDFFVVELVTEPDFGSLDLVVYGFDAAGTRAGTWHFINVLLPQADTSGTRWYVGEWTDDDGDGAPGDGDTFVILEWSS